MHDLGTALAVTAAAITTLNLATRFGPFRWVWAQLVHKPVQEGLREVIQSEVSPLLAAVRDELKTNGGSSLRDAVNRLEKQGIVLENQIAHVQSGVDEAKRTASEVRHDLEASILASQDRLPPNGDFGD